MDEQQGRPVLITTQHRGVFFGYLNGEPEKLPGEVQLSQARSVVYWSEDCKGFLGLADKGPSDSCRIGPAVDVTLYDVTCVAVVTPAAVERFEGGPWS